MYQVYEIHPGELHEFREYIPGNYRTPIQQKQMKAIAVYDGDREFGDLVGVSITAECYEWLELIWISMTETYKKAAAGSDFVRYLLRVEQRKGIYRGMFMEPHVSPELGSLKEILMFAGMDVSVEKDNIYEFRLQDVLREKSFETAAKRLPFVTLNQASRALRNQLELSVFEDERVVPAELPIPWSRYRGDISVLYHSPETGAAGMLLFSEIGDSILFELAYSSSPLILAGLVEAALEIADEAFSPEQKILVPIVRDSSRQLVDKLVPNAARGEVVEAVKWF